MTKKVRFTARRIADFTCPPEKSQALLWDLDQPGLALRTTPKGKPSFVFQGRYGGKTIRITIGSPDSWSIPEAQARARKIQREIDEGLDPRRVKALTIAADKAAREASRREGVLVEEVWSRYVEERSEHWGDSHLKDHQKMVQPAGQLVRGRPSMRTQPGMLLPLMKLRLADLDSKTIENWAAKEVKQRATRTRLAVRLLKAFLRWAGSESEYANVVDINAASGKKLRDILGKPGVRKDHLQREQLPVWFAHVLAVENQVISVYLQCLLLTGARREELAKLKWSDLNFKWKSIDLADKVEDGRSIPLTLYVGYLLNTLPRRNEWVFSSPTSQSGRLVEPAIAHRKACSAASIELTIHGLRRSFKSLTEWLDTPAGIVAQIMGHKPSAIAEKHYTVRPVDLLRVHHQKIEQWILEEAGINFDADDVEPCLRLVGHPS